MSSTTPPQPPSVVETRLVHDMHRRATTLLADAVPAGPASVDAVEQLRDLVVATLEHHHRSEDTDLWPMLLGRRPSLAAALAELSRDHEQLDAVLRQLASRPVDERGVRGTALQLRELVHDHLSREEPVLFPALAAALTDDDWLGFSQRTVASTPDAGKPMLVELLHQVSTNGAVDVLLRHLPQEARDGVPSMRAQGRAVLDALHLDGLVG
jgi:hypothetical protein